MNFLKALYIEIPETIRDREMIKCGNHRKLAETQFSEAKRLKKNTHGWWNIFKTYFLNAFISVIIQFPKKSVTTTIVDNYFGNNLVKSFLFYSATLLSYDTSF